MKINLLKIYSNKKSLSLKLVEFLTIQFFDSSVDETQWFLKKMKKGRIQK